MRGRNHVLSGVILLLAIFLIDLFLGLVVYDWLINTKFVIVLLMLYLFFAGLLLPDADKPGSWIFKFFFPFAIISWLLGFIASSLKLKRFRHRGFLHSVQGIFLSSFFISALLFLLLRLFLYVDVWVLLYFFVSVLVGQILHLLLD